MPEMDGLEVCRAIRKTSQVPIVFLSSRGEEVDKVLGLEMGGDDYLAKPFSPRELVSRVKAVLRRTRPATEQTLVEASGVKLDVEAFRVWAGEVEVTLTVTEFRILEVLLRRPGRVFTRDELVQRAYEGPHHVSDRTLDSHMRRNPPEAAGGRARPNRDGARPRVPVRGSSLRRWIPTLPLQFWLMLSHGGALVAPVLVLYASGVYGNDLRAQTQGDTRAPGRATRCWSRARSPRAALRPVGRDAEIRRWLNPALSEAKQSTRSGIQKIVDTRGVVVATSGTVLGEDLSDWPR